MKELLTFANEIGKQLEVVNRSRLMRGRYRFQAYFIGSEISEGSFLKGEYGVGGTLDAALFDYANLISGKILVFNAYLESRKEIEVPELVHTPTTLLTEAVVIRQEEPWNVF